MYNRAEIVDQNFTQFVTDGHFPENHSGTSWKDTGLEASELVDLFESQVISRHLDLRARILKNTGRCFYTIGSSGHEGNAALAKAFRLTDMSFLHYRSGAFMVQRFKHLTGSTPIYDLLLSFVASSDDPISGGRHKVFGSKDLFVPPQTSTIASHLPKAVGAALSVGRAYDMQLKGRVMPHDAVVLCNFGDASANHSTALGAFNTAGWVSVQNVKMPLVFVCEDNGLGISTKTPQDWVASTYSQRQDLHYILADGLNVCDFYLKAKQAERWARRRKKPVFLHVKTVRMLGHAGSDVESAYRALSDIEATEFQDPLLHTARHLVENEILNSQQVVDLYESVRQRVECVAEYVCTRPKLETPKAVAETIVNKNKLKEAPPLASESEREFLLGRDYKKLSEPQHMAKLMNWALTDVMGRYPGAVVFGEDVAQKGGVYHVTDNLLHRFGPKRVFNSPLDEQSILGSAIGMAHNGFLPIPEVQFLAYVHNAEDQIRGEAATLSFFSKGLFQNPMVIRVAGLAYQKGFGGHFHNDNSLAVFRDVPGLVIAVPSNGADAVKMFRSCVRHAHEYGRVVVFVEPIALYMTRDLHSEGDKLWCHKYPELEEEVELGDFGVRGSGEDLLILTYGNGVYYSSQAEKELRDEYGVKSKIIDLRWMAPLDTKRLAQEVKPYNKVLIVEECRKTGSFAEGIVLNLLEELGDLPKIKIVAAEDCFIPLGVAAAAGLPKKKEIVAGAKALLGLK